MRSAELTATTIRRTRCRCSSTSCRSSRCSRAGARGESWVYGAGELRLKETDRIDAVVDALRAIGARAKGHEDGFSVTGVPDPPEGRAGRRRGATTGSRCSGLLQGWSSRDGVEIEGADSVAISFPGFYDLLEQITQR